MQGETRNVYM